MCGSCVAWFAVGLLAVGARMASNTFTDFCEPIPRTRLFFPDIIPGEGLTPSATWRAMLCWHPRETCLILNRNNGVNCGGGCAESRGEVKERGGGETAVGLQNKRINLINKTSKQANKWVIKWTRWRTFRKQKQRIIIIKMVVTNHEPKETIRKEGTFNEVNI